MINMFSDEIALNLRHDDTDKMCMDPGISYTFYIFFYNLIANVAPICVFLHIFTYKKPKPSS